MHNLDTQTHTQPSHTHYTYHTSHTIHTSRLSHTHSTYHTVHTSHTLTHHSHHTYIHSTYHTVHTTHTAISPIKNVNLKKFLRRFVNISLTFSLHGRKRVLTKNLIIKETKTVVIVSIRAIWKKFSHLIIIITFRLT